MCWDILSIWRTLVDPFSVSPRYETHLGSSSSVALARRRIRRWAHHSNLDLIGHRVGVLYVNDLQNFFGPIECVSFFSKVVFFLDIRTRSPTLIIVKNGFVGFNCVTIQITPNDRFISFVAGFGGAQSYRPVI